MTVSRKNRGRTGGRKLLAAAIILIGITALLWGFSRIRAGAAHSGKVCYTSVRVEQGDTLWDIAREWCGNDSSASVRAYVDRIMELNGITRADNLKTGSYLTVYYYR